MYGRDYAGNTLNFEASGGLTNASLIMQDKETDTYWSIMEGSAVAGELKGQTLKELPVGSKMSWGEWRAKHPTTKVLSVNGNETGPNTYGGYFRNKGGFRGLAASDQRLPTKSPIFAFRYKKRACAVRLSKATNGGSFPLPDGGELFLYRARGDDVLRSTSVFYSERGFAQTDEGWTELTTGAAFDTSRRTFVASEAKSVRGVKGFDTYWYNWSLNNPQTLLLQPKKVK